MKNIYPKKRKISIFDGISFSNYDPYRRLWIAVITQALMDALNGSEVHETAYARFLAKKWLTIYTNDFCTVCAFAGFDPDEIIRKSKLAIKNAVKVRAIPGAGQRYHECKNRRDHRKKAKEAKVCDKQSSNKKSILILVKSESEDA